MNVDVDAVGLGAPAATLHRNAGGMHDVDFDAMRPQSPRDPEAVEARLVSHDHTPDLAIGLARLFLPPLDRLEHGVDVPGRERAQRTTRHARHAPAHLPRLAAQFQNDHQRASLVEGGRGSARIESFAHWMLLLKVLDNLQDNQSRGRQPP